MKYKGVVKFTYTQVIEVEAATQEDAVDIMCEKLDRSRAIEDEVEIYDIQEVNHG